MFLIILVILVLLLHYLASNVVNTNLDPLDISNKLVNLDKSNEFVDDGWNDANIHKLNSIVEKMETHFSEFNEMRNYVVNQQNGAGSHGIRLRMFFIHVMTCL